MVLATSSYPLLDLFWTTFIVFGWILWFWLLIRVYADLFSRRDIGGWAKTGWVLVTLLLPLVGVLIYLVSQGRSMQERAERQMQEQQAATEAYIRSVAGQAPRDERATAEDLLRSGAITNDEYERMVGGSRR